MNFLLLRNLSECKEFFAGDGTALKSILHPAHDNVELGYCIAEARLKHGKSSLWHRLKTTELYFILEGAGLMEIENEKARVKKGTTIFIPANSRQRIQNTGKKDLVFLCIVSPAWKKELEEILE